MTGVQTCALPILSNRPVIHLISRIMKEREKVGGVLTKLVHVRSHSGSSTEGQCGNIVADKIAFNHGRRLAQVAKRLAWEAEVAGSILGLHFQIFYKKFAKM